MNWLKSEDSDSEHQKRLKKRMKIMLICVGILFGSIFIYKMVGKLFLKYALSHQSQVIEVSAIKTNYSDWPLQLKAVGSLRAIRGVNVTSEVAGMVQTIAFTPGAEVTEGTLLVQLNADNDIALLHSLQANAELAKITLKRDTAQFQVQAVSKQTVDSDAANLKSSEAQVTQQQAFVIKKTIRAPFTGRLGINLINPGEYISPGNPMVMLQTLDPIYADFYLPQQTLAKLKVGQSVKVFSDTFPNETFIGKITTINPGVDPTTRNVEVEATIANPKRNLSPGMFVNVEISAGKAERFLTVPQTAISFNPYGEIAYILTPNNKDQKNKNTLIANQAFVVTGQTRGDQIAILKGLKAGDMVVTSGQLKLKNGSIVAINNTLQPSNSEFPATPNER
jgi:membrane fusion protein (multidrug efflux system)